LNDSTIIFLGLELSTQKPWKKHQKVKINLILSIEWNCIPSDNINNKRQKNNLKQVFDGKLILESFESRNMKWITTLQIYQVVYFWTFLKKPKYEILFAITLKKACFLNGAQSIYRYCLEGFIIECKPRKCLNTKRGKALSCLETLAYCIAWHCTRTH
jgi:hypothetical protein